MKKSIYSLALAAMLACTTAVAGTTYSLVGSGSKTQTQGYVGLNWSLGGGATPALVLGVSRAKVKTNGDTTGANLSFLVNLSGGGEPAKIKLGYLNGSKNTLQSELGVGYNFLKSTPLIGAGLNAPYVNLGVDWNFGEGFDPYATLRSQGAFKKPTGTTCVKDAVTTDGHYTDSTCTVVHFINPPPG